MTVSPAHCTIHRVVRRALRRTFRRTAHHVLHCTVRRETRGAPPAPPVSGRTALWRLRTTVRPEPGSPAALCTAPADRRVDVLGFRTRPRGETAVDEFPLRAPEEPGCGPGAREAGRKVPRRREALTLPQGDEIAVRRADTRDLAAVRALHRRCSARTLASRHHGPVRDADRFLDHLLSPRFGRTLVAETASGRPVALGHLLWDGDEAEVALLVEDVWQRRGIGTALLRHLVGMAARARCESLYAVTRASDTGMVATMRGLGLPLDHRTEEGTRVVSARLAPAPAAAEPDGR